MEEYFIDKLLQSENVFVQLLITFFQLITQMQFAGRTFYIGVAISLSAAALIVWCMRLIVKHVNTQYESGFGFSVGAFFSFSTTFITVILLFALQFTEPVAKLIIKGWEASLMTNQQWSQNTFRDAYENVKSLKDSQGRSLENFDGYPHPDLGGSTIPGSSDEAKIMAIDTYLEGAMDNFDDTMPLLSWILSASSGSAKNDIFRDMSEIFRNNQNYEMSSAIAIAAKEIADELVAQSDRIILLGSLVIVLMFLFIQSLITGLLSWTALRNIKEEF